MRDQAAALARLDELVGAESWRTDKRAAWTAMAQVLVHGMSWETGLVAGVTRAQLAERADVGLRTATSLLAWAQDVGWLVCVEAGASAQFLGTTTNRAPTYVLTIPLGWSPRDAQGADRRTPVDGGSCHPPASGGWEESPRRERGPKDRQDTKPWPVFDRATTASERARAVSTLLDRSGFARKVVRWRAVALLAPWFEAGWSVMGLLYALEHHPDRPAASRGDAARAARDPLRVLGHRLSPWIGRSRDLPAGLVSVDGRARRARVAMLAAGGHMAEPSAASGHGRPVTRLVATPATRAAARAEVAAALSARRVERHARPPERR